MKALKKPSTVAWTVNQLARKHKADMRKLIRAGERLRKAQTEALSGSSTRLRDAQADEREAVRALTADARKLGATDQTVERVAATLRAAAVDRDALALVEAGRLSEEVAPSGFGALAGMPVAQTKPARKPKAEDPKERRRRERIAGLRERARELTREAAAAEREAERAQRAAAKARDAADRAAAELAQVEQE